MAAGLSDHRAWQSAPLRTDIALKHGDRPIAVVEAKASPKDFRTGAQQARRYADRLDAPLAYATSGRQIIEIDMRDQIEQEVTHAPASALVLCVLVMMECRARGQGVVNNRVDRGR
ncbi:hypothetical protein [Micromonospora sp. NPDC050200]|uniref:hypothetical protein n=1 Tax=Micromonospora sp. NPDC050200 TaxID=3155664 RepID=UPI0033DE045A